MAITYKLDETYTGKRTTSMPDPDNEGKTIKTTEDVTDVIVTFTSDTPKLTHTRNVVLDSNGKYDKDSTLTRIEEVAAGVAHKVAAGVITPSE